PPPNCAKALRDAVRSSGMSLRGMVFSLDAWRGLLVATVCVSIMARNLASGVSRTIALTREICLLTEWTRLQGSRTRDKRDSPVAWPVAFARDNKSFRVAAGTSPAAFLYSHSRGSAGPGGAGNWSRGKL